MKNIKIDSILIGVSVSILLIFAGCGAPPPPKVPNSSQLPIPSINNTTKSKSTEMRTIYSDTLKGLVKAKTITRTQSDKVMEEVTKNVTQVKGNINRLSKLVKNKVITKLQADIINEKIEKSMRK